MQPIRIPENTRNVILVMNLIPISIRAMAVVLESRLPAGSSPHLISKNAELLSISIYSLVGDNDG